MSNANANDSRREPSDLQSSIEQTRQEMSATIDAIQRRLTPGQLMDQSLGYLRNSLPADFGANLAHTVRDNPVPVALIGVGIAWLALSGQSTGGYGAARGRSAAGRWDGDDSAAGDSTLHRTASAAGDAASSLRDTASDVTGRARDMARDARDRARDARDRVASTAREARERVRDLSQRSHDQYERARRTASTMLDEQPLVVGALGVAVGAALGAALPGTRTEDAWMGETRDDLVDKAKAGADEVAQRTTDSVRQVVDRLEETAADARREQATGDVHRSAGVSAPPVDRSGG